MAGEQRVMIGGLPIRAVPDGEGAYRLVVDLGSSAGAAPDANGLDVDVTRLPAGANIIGKVGIDQTTPGTTDRVTVGGTPAVCVATLNGVSPVIAAAGDYLANDIFSDSATNGAGHAFKFAGAARNASNGGLIVRLKVRCSVEAMTPRIRWHFFADLPSAATELDDNAAFYIDLDDWNIYIGYLDTPALADFGEFSFAQNISDRLAFKCGGGGVDLYAIGQFLDAVTNEAAAMVIVPVIQVEQH